MRKLLREQCISGEMVLCLVMMMLGVVGIATGCTATNDTRKEVHQQDGPTRSATEGNEARREAKQFLDDSDVDAPKEAKEPTAEEARHEALEDSMLVPADSDESDSGEETPTTPAGPEQEEGAPEVVPEGSGDDEADMLRSQHTSFTVGYMRGMRRCHEAEKELTTQENPSLDKAKKLLSETGEYLNKLKVQITSFAATDPELPERKYELNQLNGSFEFVCELFEGFKANRVSLDVVEEPSQLLGMRIQFNNNGASITKEQLRQFCVEKFKAGDGVRIWEPGMAGTADYWEHRLNVHLNEFGRVIMVRWG